MNAWGNDVDDNLIEENELQSSSKMMKVNDDTNQQRYEEEDEDDEIPDLDRDYFLLSKSSTNQPNDNFDDDSEDDLNYNNYFQNLPSLSELDEPLDYVTNQSQKGDPDLSVLIQRLIPPEFVMGEKDDIWDFHGLLNEIEQELSSDTEDDDDVVGVAVDDNDYDVSTTGS